MVVGSPMLFTQGRSAASPFIHSLGGYKFLIRFYSSKMIDCNCSFWLNFYFGGGTDFQILLFVRFASVMSFEVQLFQFKLGSSVFLLQIMLLMSHARILCINLGVKGPSPVFNMVGWETLVGRCVGRPHGGLWGKHSLMRTFWGVRVSCVGLTERISASVLAGSLWGCQFKC